MRSFHFLVTSITLATYLTGCGGLAPPELGESRQNLVTSCPFPPTSIAVDNEMIIRTRAVVDDPCRTTWNTSCPASSRAKWTFGRLMTVMSGATDETSPVARQFVGNWLNFWLGTQLVGEDPNPVAARGAIRTVLLDPWLTASGCAVGSDPASCSTLDLTKAPFRLLAIVNRIDMAGFDFYAGTGATGELRFAFGAFNSTTLAALKATVILEYRFPKTKFSSQWASMFHNLSSLALPASPPTGTGTTAFADQLQAITNLVVEPNAQPGGPNNGSSIGQIRTNENAFDTKTGFSKEWEFRQFALPCGSGSCQLVQVPVSQTPPTSALATPGAVNAFLVEKQDDIAKSTHVVPTSLLGGSSLSLAGNSAVLWGYPNPVMTPDPEHNALVRHNFGFGTCNGCHYLETANQNQQFHIAPRGPTAVSQLSNFLGFAGSLSSSDGILPDMFIEVSDPDPDTGILFPYNEPWRRACEIRRVLQGVTTPFTTPTGHSL